jgi:L-lactate dehydrogenase
MIQHERKVVIIGAGAVGATYAYALMRTGLANEIVLTDIDQERLNGEVMDLSHGLPFIPPTEVRAGDYKDCENADLIVVTAGAKQKSGQSRLQLVEKNTEIIKDICKNINQYTQDSVLVMVTNPVDVLTYVAVKELNWQIGSVMGSGTVLDTSRFKYILSDHCSIDARNTHAYIFGEHGDSEFAPWSLAHIAGIPINEYCSQCNKCDFKNERKKIVDQVRDSAYHVIDYKGATYYAIGLSLVRISEAILRDEKSVLTVSSLMDGKYGLKDVCLSVPCIVSGSGIEKVIEGSIEPDEQQALENSANKLRENIDHIRSKLSNA